MANVTGTYRGASASVTVTISDSGSAQTMQITDFGDIVFEFDITPDQPQIDRIIAMYSTVSVSVFQYDNFGNDLFDRFSTGATRSVLITIAFYNGETAYFRYELTNQSVTVNDLQKIVTL
jgi:ABC-type dipeptide/oligopeptide/nickel transport system permease subunit